MGSFQAMPKMLDAVTARGTEAPTDEDKMISIEVSLRSNHSAFDKRSNILQC